MRLASLKAGVLSISRSNHSCSPYSSARPHREISASSIRKLDFSSIPRVTPLQAARPNVRSPRDTALSSSIPCTLPAKCKDHPGRDRALFSSTAAVDGHQQRPTPSPIASDRPHARTPPPEPELQERQPWSNYTLTPSGQHDFTPWPRNVELGIPWRRWLGLGGQESETKRAAAAEAIVDALERDKRGMSDAEYAKFLEGAGGNGGGGGGDKKASFTAQSVDAEVPPVLRDVGATYTSDADEPFQAVSLHYQGKGPLSVSDFKRLTSHDDVSSISGKDFDPRGQYAELVQKVRDAVGGGQVSFFRSQLGGVRCEYWIVGVDEKGKRVVGLRAGSVES